LPELRHARPPYSHLEKKRIARARCVDPSVTRWYHCVTRCVRRAFLLGEGNSDRKQWIENRLEELARVFSIAVGGFDVRVH
jgi:hypothetical protein